MSASKHTNTHRCTSPTVHQRANRKDEQLDLMTTKSFGTLLMENNGIGFVCTQETGWESWEKSCVCVYNFFHISYLCSNKLYSVNCINLYFMTIYFADY